MNRLEHTGDSANIAFYGEKDWDQRKTGFIWCEILRTDFHSLKLIGIVPKSVPSFWITVYRHGTGKIAQRKYSPRKNPGPGRLPDAVVTRLVRDTLRKKANAVDAMLRGS